MASSWPSSDYMACETNELFYAIHRTRGLHLGPRYRSVQYAWGREGSCYTVLNVKRPEKVLAIRCERGPDGEPIMCEKSPYVFDLGLEEDLSDDLLEYEVGHPALLDGAFQSTFLSSSPVPGESPTALPIPFFIEEINWRQAIDFDGYFGETSPMQGSDGRQQKYRILTTDGKEVIGVRGFEAKIMRHVQKPLAKAADAAKVDPLADYHPVIQRAAYMGQLNGPETWGHLAQPKKEAKPTQKKAKAQSKASIAVAKELLANLSLDAVLVEDMALMESGIQTGSDPSAASSTGPASGSSAWKKWSGSQQVGRVDDEGGPEVIAVPDSQDQRKQGKRRAGTRHAKSALAA